MGTRWRPQIGHVGNIEHEMANYGDTQYLHGGQGPVVGQQEPLLSHGSQIGHVGNIGHEKANGEIPQWARVRSVDKRILLYPVETR